MIKTRESTLYGCRYLQNFKEFSVRKSGSHLAGFRYIVSSFLIESLEFLIFTLQPPRISMRKLCYCIVRSFVLFQQYWKSRDGSCQPRCTKVCKRPSIERSRATVAWQVVMYPKSTSKIHIHLCEYDIMRIFESAIVNIKRMM